MPGQRGHKRAWKAGMDMAHLFSFVKLLITEMKMSVGHGTEGTWTWRELVGVVGIPVSY